MAKYYISTDGGGTKLNTVCFDDEFNLVSQSRSGAVNPRFTDISVIEQNMREGIDKCLSNTGIKQIEHLYITMPGPASLYERILREYCDLNGHTVFSEGYACLIAGVHKVRGIVALSGTGSGVFYIQDMANIRSIGGWGALFGDEGSGYEIGATALRVAQYAVDGRGKNTLLVELIKSQFSLQNLHDIVSLVYGKTDYRSIISSICLTVCKAAEMGDTVSANIMKSAGHSQGHMVNTLIRKHTIPEDLPIVVSGSVWRYNRPMYDAFSQFVHKENPGFKIYKPCFEPVISGIVQKAFDIYGSMNIVILENIQKNFADYIYERY